MQPDTHIVRPNHALRMAVLLGLSATWRLHGADQTGADPADELLKVNGQTKALSSAIDRLAQRGALSRDENTELRLIAEAQDADMKAQEAATQAAIAQAAALRAHLKLAMAQLASQKGRPVETSSAAPQAPQPPAPRQYDEQPARLPSAPPPQPDPAPAGFGDYRQPRSAPPQPAPEPIPRARVVDTSTPNSAVSAYAQPEPRAAVDVPAPPERTVSRAQPAEEAPQPPAPRRSRIANAQAQPPAQAPLPRGEDAVGGIDDSAPSPMEQPARPATAPAKAVLAAAASAPESEPRQAAIDAEEPEVQPGTMRVTYVPDIVKQQIREEVRQDLMNDAAKEGWATPGAVPEWVTRFRLLGDLRFRYEKLFYPADNLSNGAGYGSAYWNFNAINTGSPYDINSDTNTANPPYPNIDKDRTRLRLRARLGATVELANGCSAGIRFATGESNSPVSENQSLGAASSGQGGDFSKYAVWLDRAYLTYERGGLPNQDFTVSIGRFDNPFFATTMLWADDLAFDGLATQGKFPLGDDITPFFAAGAFPVYNTDLNFSSYQPSKFKSDDKWLWAAQIGADFELGKALSLKFGSAFYYFQNIEGKISSAMVPVTSVDAGDTDSSRPSFAQKGNSYVALRTITPTYDSSNKLYPQYQYFGLATPFREMAFTTELKYSVTDRFQVSLSGEFVKNVAFNRNDIVANGPSQLKGPVNNNASDGTTFGGGDLGWITNLQVGHLSLKEPGDWNVGIGYRNVQSDAVVDGFCDSDFGGGGSNLKGYTVSFNLALLTDVSLRLRYLSAKQIAGPAVRNDVFQVDISTRF